MHTYTIICKFTIKKPPLFLRRSGYYNNRKRPDWTEVFFDSELAPKRILLDSGPSHSLDKNEGSPKHVQTYCTYENIHTCRHTYKRAYVHTYIHACARTYMHVRIMLFACCSVLVHRCCFVFKSDESCCDSVMP